MMAEMKRKLEGRRFDPPVQSIPLAPLPPPSDGAPGFADLLAALESYGFSPDAPDLRKRRPGNWVPNIPVGGEKVSLRATAAAATILEGLERHIDPASEPRRRVVFEQQKRSYSSQPKRAWSAEKLEEVVRMLRTD